MVNVLLHRCCMAWFNLHRKSVCGAVIQLFLKWSAGLYLQGNVYDEEVSEDLEGKHFKKTKSQAQQTYTKLRERHLSSRFWTHQEKTEGWDILDWVKLRVKRAENVYLAVAEVVICEELKKNNGLWYLFCFRLHPLLVDLSLAIHLKSKLAPTVLGPLLK